jgi:hypothetical protein
MKRACVSLAVLLSAVPALAGALPHDAATPGAVNPAVTQANIGSTICRRDWGRTIRPPESFTEDLKRRQLHDPESPYYTPHARLRDFEEDHWVPLSAGGAPADPRNLWPEPRFGTWSAKRKDRLEEVVHRIVCRGRMRLVQGQAVFLGDWTRGYIQFVRRR